MYEGDSLFYDAASSPEYTRSYQGFMVGVNYPRHIVFSSRKISRGHIWPTRAVREKWERIRKTQITTVPGGMLQQ